jgi:hypothetical protein
MSPGLTRRNLAAPDHLPGRARPREHDAKLLNGGIAVGHNEHLCHSITIGSTRAMPI